MSFISAATKGLSNIGGKVARLGKSALTKLKPSNFKSLSKIFRKGVDVTSDDTKDIKSLGEATDNNPLLPRRINNVDAEEAIEKLLEDYKIDRDKVEDNIRDKENTVEEIVEESDEDLEETKADLDRKLNRHEITPLDYQTQMQESSTTSLATMVSRMMKKQEEFKDEMEVFNADVVSSSFSDIKDSQKETKGILSKIYDLGKMKLLGLKQGTQVVLQKLNPITAIKDKISTIEQGLKLIDPAQWITLAVFAIGSLISNYTQGIKDSIHDFLGGSKQIAGNVGSSISSSASNAWGWIKDKVGVDKYENIEELLKGKDKDGKAKYVNVSYRKYEDGRHVITNVDDLSEEEYNKKSKDKEYTVIGTDHKKSILNTIEADKLIISTGDNDIRKLPVEFKDTAVRKSVSDFESAKDKREREKVELSKALTPTNPGGRYNGDTKITNHATGLTGNVAYRNNNPGNLILTKEQMHNEVRPAPSLKERGSNSQIKNGFRTFKTQKDGFEAIFDNLENSRYYFKSGNNTIEGIINRWCPNSPEYIKFVENTTGINRRAKIDINNKKAMVALATAIYRREDINGWRILKPKVVSNAYDSYMDRVHGNNKVGETVSNATPLYSANVATQGGDTLNSFNKASEANTKGFIEDFHKSAKSFDSNNLAMQDKISQLQETIKTTVSPRITNNKIDITPTASIDMNAPGIPDYLNG